MESNFQSINPRWIDVVGHKPKFIKIKKSLLHNKGAFSKKKILKGTFLGHYMGNISKNMLTGPYVFHSKTSNGTISIDASDINYSNWTRYMNCSTNKSNENVNSYILTNNNYNGYIVFYANRDIKKDEELLYFYGNMYGKLLGINYS